MFSEMYYLQTKAQKVFVSYLFYRLEIAKVIGYRYIENSCQKVVSTTNLNEIIEVTTNIPPVGRQWQTPESTFAQDVLSWNGGLFFRGWLRIRVKM